MNRAYTIRVPRRWAHVVLAVVLTTLVVAPITAIAAGRFVDVPDSHTFVRDIEWLAETGVTRGCNPQQDNTRFCPDDTVTRGEMAAFLHRLADNRVVDAGALGGTPAKAFLSDLTTVTAVSQASDNPHKVIEATCPAGYVATGGGAIARIIDGDTSLEQHLVVRSSISTFRPSEAVPSGWIAFAESVPMVAADWRLDVRVICARTG